jgi:hypothetical protein
LSFGSIQHTETQGVNPYNMLWHNVSNVSVSLLSLLNINIENLGFSFNCNLYKK